MGAAFETVHAAHSCNAAYAQATGSGRDAQLRGDDRRMENSTQIKVKQRGRGIPGNEYSRRVEPVFLAMLGNPVQCADRIRKLITERYLGYEPIVGVDDREPMLGEQHVTTGGVPFVPVIQTAAMEIHDDRQRFLRRNVSGTMDVQLVQNVM